MSPQIIDSERVALQKDVGARFQRAWPFIGIHSVGRSDPRLLSGDAFSVMPPAWTIGSHPRLLVSLSLLLYIRYEREAPAGSSVAQLTQQFVKNLSENFAD